MKNRVVNIVIDYLRQEGIRYIFGLTGHAIDMLIDATLDYDDIEFVGVRHEGGAGFMAYGYAVANKTIGVCCGTTGGGITNLVTGVAAAYMQSVPMLVFTGQVKLKEYGKNTFQEATGEGRSVNSVGIFKNITKHSTAILRADKAPEIIRQAIRTAVTGKPGPVHISIPIDIAKSEIEHSTMDRRFFLPSSKMCVDTNSIENLLNLIKESESPVLLVGSGALLADAKNEVLKFAELINVPIITSLQAKAAVSTDHDLCLGALGMCGHGTATNYITEKSDLVIAVGFGFNKFSTFGWSPKINKNNKIVQIDIDPEEIGKNYPIELGIVGDIKDIFGQIFNRLNEKSVSYKSSLKKSHKCAGVKYFEPDKINDLTIPLKPQRVMQEIGMVAPDNTAYVVDCGSHWGWAEHYLPIRKETEYYMSINFGSMGFAVASSLGIKLAKKNNPVICICGDGCFQMNGNEIATAKQFNIPVVWIILNDSRLGMQYHATSCNYGRTIGTTLIDVDFSKVASAFNIRSYVVKQPNEMLSILPQAIQLKEPVVIDVRIDPDEAPPVKQEGM